MTYSHTASSAPAANSRTVITLKFPSPKSRENVVEQLEETVMRRPAKKQPMRKATKTKKQLARTVENTSEKDEAGVLLNFRKARGLPNIFRCARTDDLAERLEAEALSSAEKVVLYKAGLILDLRSISEVRQQKVGKWTREAPGGQVRQVPDADLEQLLDAPRCLVNLDVLSKKDFAAYVEKHWLTSTQEQIQVAYCKAFDGKSLHRMRVDALNKRGVLGLNEAILESGKPYLCQALRAITVHLEKKDDSHRPVVIHCAQGKDRTGMVVMLLQSLMGVSDNNIIEDYHASEVAVDFDKGRKTRTDDLDRAMMKSAPRLAMVKTLQYLRERYGSVSPGYLQDIGFDDSWRVRLMTVLLLDMSDPRKARKSKKSRL